MYPWTVFCVVNSKMSLQCKYAINKRAQCLFLVSICTRVSLTVWARSGDKQKFIFSLVWQVQCKFWIHFYNSWTLRSIRNLKNFISGLKWSAESTLNLKCSLQIILNRKWKFLHFLYSLEFKNFRSEIGICIEFAKREKISICANPRSGLIQ